MLLVVLNNLMLILFLKNPQIVIKSKNKEKEIAYEHLMLREG